MIDINKIPSPCYVMEEKLLRNNLSLIKSVKERAGVNIILAFKAFALWKAFPIVREYIPFSTASSKFEAQLAFEEMGSPAHTYSPAYTEADFPLILRYSSHVTFNSLSQFHRFYPMVRADGNRVSCGLRINPEYSDVETDLYNPCAPGSRMGVTGDLLGDKLPEGIEGLHFHTLCEQGADALDRTLKAFEMKFGRYLKGLKWMNFGGGHHITKEGYDIDLLCKCIERVRDRYGVQVYLEPGEAVALNAGVLVSTVLDVVRADMPVAILDTSAATHMPDVLEMPYRPMVIGSGEPGEKRWSCRLAGKSCLAGDVIGEYSFDEPLKAGDRLVFTDMAIYSMVKTTTFNGLRLPSIVRWNPETDETRLVREFGYEDFKYRLGKR